MSTLFLSILFLGLLIGLVVGMIILLILQVKNSSQVNKLTFPAYEYVVKQAEHKANGIIESAQKEARAIVSAAETSGQKIIEEHTQTATRTHEEYVKTIEQYTNALTEKLNSVAQDSHTHLESVANAAIVAVQKQHESVGAQFDIATQRVHEIGDKLEMQANKSATDLEAHIQVVSQALVEKLQHEDAAYKTFIGEHLSKAIAVAEAQVVEYQKARIALLDTNIEKLVEDVTARVLHKELTVSQHAELALQALKEAKEHNVI